MSCEKSFDQDDTVDPRVQIELERLNTATDEINKLEVDLDEARNQFRQLLSDSTVRIDVCSKKLGNCIEKARPYYDARLKAKEALQETQKAAVNFERANSAHAAAKEMVYLAEEGLKTEGRTFDHAWQEMLNHATMRVNESESERTRSEGEHRRTSQNYQRAEIRVQSLQKDLKRAITKSSLRIRRQLMLMNNIAKQHDLLFLPYFELKIHYNQLLEQQKNRVKSLEKQVSQVKTSYADTLRNLEQISDEIHKTRQSGKASSKNELGTRSEGVGAESSPGNGFHCNSIRPNLPKSISGCAKATNSFHNDSRTENNVKSKSKGDEDGRGDSETGKLQATSKMLTPLSETDTNKLTPNTSGSSQPDTDFWSESSGTGHTEGNGDGDSCTGSAPSENDSSMTGPPDSESEDEFFKLPDKLGCLASPNVHRTRSFFPPSPDFKGVTAISNKNEAKQPFENKLDVNQIVKNPFLEGVGICSFPLETELNFNFPGGKNKTAKAEAVDENNCNWTEIKLHSPEDEQFLTVKKNKGVKNKNDVEEEEFDIPYAPLSEVDGDFSVSVNPLASPPEEKEEDSLQKTKLDNSVSGWMTKNSKNDSEKNEDGMKSCKSTPRKMNIRRQSLDVLWSNATGEKVKEILSQSIMKLSIGSLTERRSSESKVGEQNEQFQEENTTDNSKVSDGSYESNLTSQFGLQFFSKKNNKVEEEVTVSNAADENKTSSPQDSFSNQIGGFISRKERFFTKKVPSPLEKTLGYLNADEESNSDSESLASMDMLTDEQLSSLVLDQDLTELYQDIIS